MRNIRHLGELSHCAAPKLGLVCLGGHDVVEMIFQRIFVCGCFVPPNALEDLDDDIRISLSIKIDFLMIWDLANVAATD